MAESGAGGAAGSKLAWSVKAMKQADEECKWAVGVDRCERRRQTEIEPLVVSLFSPFLLPLLMGISWELVYLGDLNLEDGFIWWLSLLLRHIACCHKLCRNSYWQQRFESLFPSWSP